MASFLSRRTQNTFFRPILLKKKTKTKFFIFDQKEWKNEIFSSFLTLSLLPFSLAGHLVGFILVGRVFRSLTVKTDDVTKGRKDLDPHGRLRAVQGRMG